MAEDARQRTRFRAALVLYLGWLVALVALGVVTAEPPPAAPNPTPPAVVDEDDVPAAGR